MSKTRGNWSSWREFLFSVMGSMVGLGNIWRFPYVCFQSGGAAFLIPYILSMIVCGIPAMFLELAYSQYSNLGPGRVWIVCPLFQGIGFGMVTLIAIIGIYYNIILAWTLYYLASSFTAVLPWSTCNNYWNSENCQAAFNQSNATLHNITWNETRLLNFTSAEPVNKTVTPSEEFWRYKVLDMSSGIDDPGSVRWQLLLCLMAAWAVVFLCLIKGIKSSGKVVYVTATLPYIILVALLVRGCLLPGALDGIRYYSIPQWEKLKDIKVWRNAAAQVFYSIGAGMGWVVTLASYNKFHNNCHRDTWLLPVLDGLTSWFAGLIIFIFLGHTSHQANIPIQQVVQEGPGLVFMAYPNAVSTMPLSQLWSVLFFIMLFTVGLDSQFVHVQVIVGAASDAFPRQFANRKRTVTAAVCILGFLLGIPCVTQGGIYVLTLMDWYVGSLSVILLAVLEMLVLAWIYGVNRLYDDISMMIGYRVPWIWKPMWLVITPLFLVILMAAGLVHFSPVTLNGKDYPGWAQSVGWIIAILPLLPVPLGMIAAIRKETGSSLKEKCINSTKPRKEWKPALTGNELQTENAEKVLLKDNMLKQIAEID